ncbi:hypothetical protein KIN20_011747 [Parelaphostrongylus tenuis]|uniref:RuvB-like helicase n=1 Tax=Parelaphostrongylus tenuis TaxID=148309 RepID=A0AAD5M9X3_PARTN|nr:hypothetical protein KIN20_011747 [Parelaphostrongylus tenuis]
MALVGDVELRSVVRVERVGAHSHIHGLGVASNFDLEDVADGMVGQIRARKAAAVVVKIVQTGNIAGRGVLIHGQPGTGKTAIAMGIAKALGQDTPFVSVSASEIFSVEMSKSEALTPAFRKAIGVRIKEETEVLEGEVVSIEMDRPASGVGPKVGKLSLKTTDMETIYDLGSKMVDQCIKLRICAGDVIQIDKGSGRLTRVGRSAIRSHDYDAMGPQTKFVPCPKGEIQTTREVVHTVCLHEIDVINSRSQGFLALFSGDTGEIKVKFVNRSIRRERGVVRGTDVTANCCLPSDLVDRLIGIATKPYTSDEIGKILSLSADEEGVRMEAGAITLLKMMVAETSMRYGMQMIAASNVLRERRKKQMVTKDEISAAYKMFYDTKRSEIYLTKNSDKFLT